MSWVQDLCQLYENNKALVGIMDYKIYKTANGEERVPFVLLPPFHTTVTAQITVTIDAQGEFLEAAPVDNSDKLTIIPVTEKSGSRTAGKEAHPLCDNLKYVAGDYVEYMDASAADDAVCFELYIQALEKWHLSPYTHGKVDAIYAYLSKRCLVQDLVRAGVLILDDQGHLSDKEKIQSLPQSKAFIRFCVAERMDGPEDSTYDRECWKDRTLQNSFIDYYRSMAEGTDICYLSGEQEQISYLHSKKIRNEGDGSKLISSNDTTNFTFRGRFLTKEQAFAIGSETSQIVHNALKWIIRRQGKTYDTLCIVTWESAEHAVPRWDADTDAICAAAPGNMGADPIDEDPEDEDWEDDEVVYDTNALGAEKFHNAMLGYGRNLEGLSNMILMALDAATTGRLALVEYKSLETTRYLKNINSWHTECQWIHEKRNNGKWYEFFGMVGVRDIADILYGSESKGVLTIAEGNRKRMYAVICKRILPCIWNRSPLPVDLMNLAIDRASSPLAYKDRKNWERVLTLACSFIKKHRHEKNPEEVWTVALDENCKDRSYLYGRLLAVADRVEYKTFDPEKDTARVTNAKRYMTVFSQRPYDTWKVIEESLQPYYPKLKIQDRLFYLGLIEKICDKFEVGNFSSDDKLEGLYLLGFHHQSVALKKKKSDAEEADK